MRRFWWLSVLLLLWSLEAVAAPRYRVTDLGYLNPVAKGTVPINLNNRTWVVGYTINSDDLQRAFLWRNGSMQELGALNPDWFSAAFGINDSGQVVGLSGDEASQRAFRWENGVMQELGALPGGDDAFATAINRQGKIVGVSTTANEGEAHPFLWQNGSFTDLGTLGGTEGMALAINNSDQVVGYSKIKGDIRTHAFLWQQGHMTDLGTLGGDHSAAEAINDAGQVVGKAYDQSGQERAFLWENGVMSPLDSGAATEAFSINNQGQILGVRVVEGEELPFLRDKGVIYDLNALIASGPGWKITKANAINNLGQIVGEAEKNGEALGVLLSPITVPTWDFLLLD